jgi:hypothetical protein
MRLKLKRAEISLRMIEDFGLLVEGMLGSILIILRGTSILQVSPKPTA